MDFTGFPVAALDFYEDLEMDNTKSFWQAHKQQYAESVAGPMKALCSQLESEFGKAKVFRPYRDVRFSKDKTPYKTHQGAFVAAAPATGWYVELSAAGLRTGAGFYEATPTRLAALRAAIDDDRRGVELEKMIARLEKKGWELGGDRVKTSPRGWATDHPRIELLRHRSMTLGRNHGFEGLNSPGVVEWVRRDWREMAPFVSYLTRPDVLDQ